MPPARKRKLSGFLKARASGKKASQRKLYRGEAAKIIQRLARRLLFLHQRKRTHSTSRLWNVHRRNYYKALHAKKVQAFRRRRAKAVSRRKR
jgi:hypothetical protein